MSISPAEITSKSETNSLLQRWLSFAAQREEQVFLALTLVIGALVGLAVVAFIVLTERMGIRLYPVSSVPWRRVLSAHIDILPVVNRLMFISLRA